MLALFLKSDYLGICGSFQNSIISSKYSKEGTVFEQVENGRGKSKIPSRS
jgi:hypothetical protein